MKSGGRCLGVWRAQDKHGRNIRLGGYGMWDDVMTQILCIEMNYGSTSLVLLASCNPYHHLRNSSQPTIEAPWSPKPCQSQGT